jgi:proliferating cell nuclear antigen
MYECKKDKIIIGVNVAHLCTLLNSSNQVERNEIMTLYIENADYSEGIVSFLSLKHENGEIRQCKIQKLRLIEPEPEELNYPNVLFPSTIILPSIGFQRIITNLSAISDRVEIKSVGSELIFKCEGQFASARLHRSESDGSMSFSVRPDLTKIIQGVFSLKHLGYFTKCTDMSDNVELHLENDLPLVVKYNVRSLGELKLCLAQLPSF